MTDWWDFVSRYIAARETNGAQVAAKAGYDKSLLTRWSRGSSPTPKMVRDTALALNAPVLDAFIAAGYLQPEDTTIEAIERPIGKLTDDELLAEVRHRMRGERRGLEVAPQSAAPPPEHENEEAASDSAPQVGDIMDRPLIPGGIVIPPKNQRKRRPK